MTRIEAPEAERMIAGCALRDPTSIDTARGLIGPGDFTDHRCRLVYLAAGDLWDARRHVDIATVLMLLTQRNQAEELGANPALFLADLYDFVQTAANLEYAAEQVKDAAMRRDGKAEAGELMRDMVEPTGPAAEMVEAAVRKLSGLLDKHAPPDEPEHIRAVLRRAWDRYDALSRGEGPQPIPTGILELDRITAGGLRPGEFVIAAARTSGGKSVLANQIVRGAAAAGHPGLFVGLEMSNDETCDRMVSATAGVALTKLRRGKGISRDESERITGLLDSPDLGKLPIYLSQKANLTVAQIAATARRFVRRHGVRVVAVDYIQLVAPANRNASRVEQVSQISRELKTLAMQLGIVIIAAAQLNREAADEEPKLHHLRESGSLEQDPNVVLLLHRHKETATNARIEDGEAFDLIVAKQRNGEMNVRIDLEFQGKYVRFVERSVL